MRFELFTKVRCEEKPEKALRLAVRRRRRLSIESQIIHSSELGTDVHRNGRILKRSKNSPDWVVGVFVAQLRSLHGFFIACKTSKNLYVEVFPRRNVLIELTGVCSDEIAPSRQKIEELFLHQVKLRFAEPAQIQL